MLIFNDWCLFVFLFMAYCCICNFLYIVVFVVYEFGFKVVFVEFVGNVGLVI